MKKNLLLLFVCLFGALGGVKAYTVDDLTEAGWTLATSLDDITSNVYVLVDAGAQETAVVRGAAQANRPRYNTLSNPIFNKQEVWAIEKYGDNYAILGIEDNYYFSSGDAGWNDGMANGVDGNNGLFTFTLSGEKYDIRAASFSGDNYMGHWNGKGKGVNISENDDWSQGDGMEDIAVNKASSNAPGYRLYKMAKRVYLRKYLQQVPNLADPVDVSYLIFNSKIYQGGVRSSLPTGWSNYGDHDVNDGVYTEDINNTHLYGMRTANKATVHNLDFDYYQTINSLPGGKYCVKADVFGPNSSHGSQFKAYLYIYATSKKSVQMDSQTWTLKTTEYDDLKDGSSLNIGMEADFDFDGGGLWGSTHTADAKGDNFRLEVDPYISSMATGLPANGTITAGLWYHFEVFKPGKHVLTATNLNDIIYATGSTTTLSAAGSSKFTAVQNLEAGDYYVRSSSANTLTVTSCISSVATKLSNGGAMTADKWYYFDVATAGNYDFVASSLDNIVYTTDGDLAEDASVASKFSVKDNELSTTRYYVKSSSAQTTLQWYLTDKKDYSSSMSSSVDDWTGDTGIYDGVALERYNGNNKDFTAGDILYQTINNLPNGNYEVTLWAWENFAPWDKDSNPHPTGDNIAQVFANDAAHGITVIEAYNERGWNDENKYTLNCHVTNGTLIYGVKNIATGGNWAVCRPISLTYTGPYNEVVESGETQTYEGAFTENVVVTPTAKYPIVDISGAEFTGTLTADFGSDANGFIIATAEQKAVLGSVKNVVVGNTCDNLVLTDDVKAVIPAALTQATSATYSRTIAAASNYGTICLPYAVESDENIQYYTVNQIVGNVLKLTEAASVEAGKPAIFKKKNGEATNITAAASNVAVTDDAGVEASLVGTFKRLAVGDEESSTGTAANKYYYIKNNEFVQGLDYFYINPFRAYIDTNDYSEKPARLVIDTDGATAISELKTLDEEQGLKDGKYLIGGKIIVVKAGKQFNVNGVLK